MRRSGTLGMALLIAATVLAQEPLELETQFAQTVPILGGGLRALSPFGPPGPDRIA